MKYKIIYKEGIYFLFKKNKLFYSQVSAHASLEDLYIMLDKIHYQALAIKSALNPH